MPNRCSCALDTESPMGQMMCHKSDQAMSPLMNFDRMGLMSDKLIAAHMTTLTPEEITICGDKIVSVAHCPTSNMKLVCGNSPVEVRPRPRPRPSPCVRAGGGPPGCGL